MSSRAPRQDRPVVYDDVHGFSPLLRAFRRARRAKRGKGAEPAFYCDLEAELLELSEALRTYRYCPDPYRYFRLRNTKERLVSEASFRDRVVHHSLVAAQEVLFESRFIDHSYACRKGKGVHAAVRRVHRLAKHNRYALRLDVRKYFDHLDHGVLQSLLARRIDDAGILWLTDTILAHACVPSVPFSERRGIPIGNLTSQRIGHSNRVFVFREVRDRSSSVSRLFARASWNLPSASSFSSPAAPRIDCARIEP